MQIGASYPALRALRDPHDDDPAEFIAPTISAVGPADAPARKQTRAAKAVKEAGAAGEVQAGGLPNAGEAERQPGNVIDAELSTEDTAQAGDDEPPM